MENTDVKVDEVNVEAEKNIEHNVEPIAENKYAKFKVNVNEGNTFNITDPHATPTHSYKESQSDKEINKNCEIQLTAESYALLAKILKHKVQQNLNEYKTAEDEMFITHKKNLKDSIAHTHKYLATSKNVFSDLAKSYDELKDSFADDITSRDDKVKFKIITDATEIIRSNLNKAKKTIEELNGWLIPGGQLKTINSALNELKTKAVSRSKHLKDVRLDDFKNEDGENEIVTGRLITTGFRIQNRNLKGDECRFESVNVNTKVYKVKYTLPGPKNRHIEVPQKYVCLVSDEKYNRLAEQKKQ